ncbi:acyl-CoA dehydrogenase [Verticiella sediminum]|uniref:Acyl-CoA dehydrogenase n=1 Tax=Verticiella sediminum TaxID=1247510 RepID=A0A556AMP5_9BURK|nr:acyl-CoA dehydrogenase [Verticiella sediminum]TSH94164.1 acyl-CoA dehydrogenase [Verticiella sediminum]
MFDLSDTEEGRMVREAAGRFAAECLAPAERAHEAAGAPAASVREQARDMGLARIGWPQALGGAELSLADEFEMLRVLASGDAGAALALSAPAPAGRALSAAGGVDAVRRHLCGLPADAGVWLHVDADAGLAIADGCISGAIPWLPVARLDCLLIARPDGLSVVRAGCDCTPVPGGGLRAAGAVGVTLERAPVAEHWPDPGVAVRATAYARLYVVALMVGQMQAAFEHARAYALERVAFGKPIAHHQALAFLMTDMRAAIDASRLMGLEAASRDARVEADEFERAAAQAYLEAAEAGMFVGPNAVQILGAAGFMQDHPVEKAMRELRALGLLAGGVDAARNALNRLPVPDAGSGFWLALDPEAAA